VPELSCGKRQEADTRGLPKIDITFDSDGFTIVDTCGGIGIQEAKTVVFRFGTIDEQERGALSVYGIGLKRAVFKLGRVIEVRSRTEREGFRVAIKTASWMSDDGAEKPKWTSNSHQLNVRHRWRAPERRFT